MGNAVNLETLRTLEATFDGRIPVSLIQPEPEAVIMAKVRREQLHGFASGALRNIRKAQKAGRADLVASNLADLAFYVREFRKFNRFVHGGRA